MNSARLPVCLAVCGALILLVGLAAPASAVIIFQDDFNRADGKVSAAGPNVGSYDIFEETNAKIESNEMVIYPPFGSADMFGQATQTSGPGTQLHWEWNWKLESNDNEGIVYAPYAALARSGCVCQRTLSIRLVYRGSSSNPPTHADLMIGDNFEEDIDTGLDIPMAGGFRRWSVDYTVGEPTATLGVEGLFANQSINVAFPNSPVTGVYYTDGNTHVNTRFDDVLLEAIDLRADFDEDNDVDGRDFLTWQRNNPTLFFAAKGDGDADGDFDVDGDDLGIWQQGFGTITSSPAMATASATKIPEPTGTMLALVAAVGVAATWSCRGRMGWMNLMCVRGLVLTLVAPMVFGMGQVRADTVTVDLEYRTDTLAWELYALIVDTGSGNNGDHGLAALRALIDNIDFGTNGDAVNIAAGIGAIDPIDFGGGNQHPPVLQTNGGTLDIIYGQDTSDAQSVVGGVGINRTLIMDGTFPAANTPPMFGNDDSGFPTDGNFLSTAAPGPFSQALPWDGVTANVINVTPGGDLGDFNGDGKVDAADYTVWMDNLGLPEDGRLHGNGDGGTVASSDYILWKNNYQSGLGAASSLGATAVPEPSAAALLLMGLSLLVAGRRVSHVG